jgi:O-antigen/teichoic acid export membrane protein
MMPPRLSQVQASATVRHAWLLATLRGSQILAALVYALLVPRAMGPETFGRYGLAMALAGWFLLFSGMGAAQAMARFLPPFVAAGDREGLRAFVTSFLSMRLLGGLAAAASYTLVTRLWFPELDRGVVALIAAVLLAAAIAKPLYAVFLGLNLASRWGLGETLRLWLSLGLLLLGFHWAGLRGACLGVLVTELVVLALGWRAVAPHLAGGRWRFDRGPLRSYWRFGVLVFVTSVFIVTSQRSGELLARSLSSDWSAVGVFGAANRVFLTGWQISWQVGMAFTPLFVSLRAAGGDADVARWSQRLLKGAALATVAAFYAVWLVGPDLVPLLFGPGYREAAPLLLILAGALVVLALGAQARLLALVYDRQADALAAAALQFAMFWSLGHALAPLGAGRATAGAMLGAVAASTAFLSWRVRRHAPLSAASWVRVLALGAAFLPLGLARAERAPAWNSGLLLLFLAGYSGLAFASRTVTLDELRALWRATRRRPLEQVAAASALEG